MTANFKETQLEHMRPGQSVEIRVDALGGQKFQGKVTNIGGATGAKFSLLPPENATGNYVKVVQRVPVRIDFDGRDKRRLQSGRQIASWSFRGSGREGSMSATASPASAHRGARATIRGPWP